MRLDSPHELVERITTGFYFADSAGGVVADPAREPKTCGRPIDKGAKSNSLNCASNFNMKAFRSVGPIFG